MKKLSTLPLFILSISACSLDSKPPVINPNIVSVKNMLELNDFACSKNTKNNEIWGKNTLYDCNTRKLYIPYQLWTGAIWDGRRTKNCMHTVNSTFNVDGDSLTTIKGPKEWLNPATGKTETVWVRDKVDGSKSQYFTCHEKGIGRVYDSRRARTYLNGRCKFPAGEGWELSKRRDCENTVIRITNMTFNKNGILQSMKFKWWVGGNLDHIYRYKPNYGMTDAWQQ